MAGLNISRCDCNSGRTPQAEAVVNDRMDRAVRPLLSDAKHALRAEAGPMRSLICLRLRMVASSWSSACCLGPEMTIDGFFQVLSVWRVGGPPIIPPSKKFIGMDSMSGSDLKEKEDVRLRIALGRASVVMSEAIDLADLGDMALRSMYVSDGVRLFLFAAAVDLQASTIRLALAIASRGGTMLRIISVSTTRASSLGRSVIWALLIRSNVDALVSISHRS